MAWFPYIEQQIWERAREQSHGLPCANSRARLTDKHKKVLDLDTWIWEIKLSIIPDIYCVVVFFFFNTPRSHYIVIFSFKLHFSLRCSTFCVSLTFFLLGSVSTPGGTQTGWIMEGCTDLDDLLVTCKPHKKGPNSEKSSSQVSRGMWHTSPY